MMIMESIFRHLLRCSQTNSCRCCAILCTLLRSTPSVTFYKKSVTCVKLTAVTHAGPDAEINRKQIQRVQSIFGFNNTQHLVVICSFFGKLKRSSGSSFYFFSNLSLLYTHGRFTQGEIRHWPQADWCICSPHRWSSSLCQGAPPLNHLSHTWVSVVVGIPFYEPDDQSILQSNPPVNHV